MRHRPFAILVALVIGLSGITAPAQTRPPTDQATAAALADDLLGRLPPEWRPVVKTVLTMTTRQQQQLRAVPDETLRQTIARLLARNAAAAEFVKSQVRTDPSSRVRTTIVQVMSSDPRWLAAPDTATILERVAASDPEASVSLAALEGLRRLRMRELSALLNERVAAAKTSGDTKPLEQLVDEQERWISLERGTMLPAFLRTAPAPFVVAPADRAVRAIAFGDFGNGSLEQKTLAQTIAAYHREHPVDIGITLGDNFYTNGMESPADPRWQTWWEELYGPLGIPFYASFGNHDWGFADSPAAEILYTQKSSSWRMPASYYTFSAGPVQFFALDTQSIALSEKQVRWLDVELARSPARWKIVYGHHPIYSGGNYEERPDLIDKLLPTLRNRADVYICGHDHNLQALKPEGGVRFYVAGGGGAGLYELRPYDRSIFASSTNGFAVIDADATRLTVTFIDANGKVIFEDVLKKEGTGSPSGR